MANPNTATRLSGLGSRLVREGFLTEQDAIAAAEQAIKDKVSLVEELLSRELVNAKTLATTSSQEFGIPVLDLDAFDRESIPKDLVGEKLMRSHRTLPLFKRGNNLFLAVSDPTNYQGLEAIRFSTGLATEAILVEHDKLMAMIDKVLTTEDSDSLAAEIDDADFYNLDFSADDDEKGEEKEEDTAGVDETPVVLYINKVLTNAINSKVSDIHFEPYEKKYRIRYRQDGILREVEVPKPLIKYTKRLASRIKVMAKMNIAERRVPQDGRISFPINKNRVIDFRANTCPTLYGEKIVLRILDAGAAQLGVDALGFEPVQKEAFMKAISRPYGLILVTGPTGSGKTVTLYTALNILNRPEVNISTCEDPVEIQVAGINQVNVNPRAGLTFAEALRAFLRQDPDIIMVGEIRDLETAEIAVKAAQTGHLVLSTLHTNDAPQTLTRLANMGVPPFNIASAVNLILAQRLARKLCEKCKTEDSSIPKEALLKEGFTQEEIDGGLTIYKAVGCDKCTGGYKGRIGLFQVMPVSEAMGRIIMEGGNSIQLADQAVKEGVNDLRKSGLLKVKHGLLDLLELNRVTQD